MTIARAMRRMMQVILVRGRRGFHVECDQSKSFHLPVEASRVVT
jgi:hypothetical protein